MFCQAARSLYLQEDSSGPVPSGGAGQCPGKRKIRKIHLFPCYPRGTMCVPPSSVCRVPVSPRAWGLCPLAGTARDPRCRTEGHW